MSTRQDEAPLPEALTPAAKEARREFEKAVVEQEARTKAIALNVLVWGPGKLRSGPVADKRADIKTKLWSAGHNAMFSEELIGSDLSDVSLLSKEFYQALSADLVFILVENSDGARGEMHDFANHIDLFQRLFVSVPLRDKGGYAGGSCGTLMRATATFTGVRRTS